MGRRTQIALSFIAGIGLGLVAGMVWLAPMNVPPPLSPGEQGAMDDVGLPTSPTAVSAAVPPMPAAAPRPRPEPAPAPEAPDAGATDPDAWDLDEDGQVLVPAKLDQPGQAEDDASLMPRGPGKYAVLDLASAKVGRLNIRRGRMERDGDGRFGAFAGNEIIGYLRGRTVRVELLHLGFDGQGRATVAHIRTLGDPPIEGVVALASEDKLVPLLRDRKSESAASAAEPPLPPADRAQAAPQP